MAFIKKYFFYILILSFAGVILFAFLNEGRNKYGELKKMQREREKYSAIINELKEKNKMLASEIRRLRKDKQYLESTTRRELGLVKENEVIYRFKGGLSEDIDKKESLK